MKQNSISKPRYVARVLSLYTGLAETPTKSSRIDKRLAEELYDKQIALDEVEAAMILATGRRLMRCADAPTLGPIRSLHYFLPLIEEIRSAPISADYIEYLRRKMATLEQRGQIRPYKT
jgi:hypothetical protein